jgi:hypothetical protein
MLTSRAFDFIINLSSVTIVALEITDVERRFLPNLVGEKDSRMQAVQGTSVVFEAPESLNPRLLEAYADGFGSLSGGF